MIAVDTNLLVYAHARAMPLHESAREAIRVLAETRRWAIPWPCLQEFYGVVTHPRVLRPPTPPQHAVAQIEQWLSSPSVSLLADTKEDGWSTLRELIVTCKIKGPQIHDARIAALCLQHGVTELWSCDRDFSRYPALRVVNPLISVPTRTSVPRATWHRSPPREAEKARRATSGTRTDRPAPRRG